MSTTGQPAIRSLASLGDLNGGCTTGVARVEKVELIGPLVGHVGGKAGDGGGFNCRVQVRTWLTESS